MSVALSIPALKMRASLAKNMKKQKPSVVKSFPYWAELPVKGQDLHNLEWGVMEVLSDGSLRFVKTEPDPEELEKLIAELQAEGY